MRAPIAMILVLTALAPRAGAVTGDLDPTFGTAGSTVTTLGYGAPGQAVLRQSTGKLVVAGTVGTALATRDDVAVLRYDADGALDPTFGTGGVATVDVAPRYATTTGAALQADDSIVVVGVGSDLSYALANPSLLVVRFTPDGALDPSFGTGGLVVVPDAGLWMRDVRVQPDGRILAAGEIALRFAAVRLEADGDLDPTFGVGGIANTLTCCAGTSLALLPGGGVLLAGHDQDDAMVMRLDANGAVDPTFGVGGVARFPFLSGDRAAADAVAVLGDGRIVVSGSLFFFGANYAVYHGVARLLAGGALDPTFGSGGTVATPVGFHGFFGDHGSGSVAGLAVDGAGRLLVLGAGAFGPPFARQVELLRYLPDGALDPSFGYGGRTFTRLLDQTHPGALLLLPDGRLVVAGSAAAPGALFEQTSWTISRYLSDCPAVPDADGDGLGDACDPCTGGALPDRAVLSLVKVDAPPGDDRFKLSARGQLPAGAPIDPLATGIRIVLADATGAVLLDTTIPPGLADPALEVGWTGSAGRFRYRNVPAIVPRVQGLSGVSFRQLAGGEVRLTIKGKEGSYPFGAAPLPLRATIVLTPPRGASGLCFETDFTPGGGCVVGNGRLKCRQ